MLTSIGLVIQKLLALGTQLSLPNAVLMVKYSITRPVFRLVL